MQAFRIQMKNSKLLLILAAALLAFTLAACATRGQGSSIHYDLGPMRVQQKNQLLLSATPPFLLTEVHATYWLDNTMMHYRLAYANDQQTRSYANSRWNMPPANLFEQRFKARISAAGGTVLPAMDGTREGILLRLELDDFSQQFDAADRSAAQVALRVSAFKKGALLGQKTFRQILSALSADADGGARALTDATDRAIDDAIAWLAEMQQRTND